MKKNLSNVSMFSILGAAAFLIVSLFFPWWKMDFYAPQYPEGLDIIVTPTELQGDIDIVNSLNHYIGMANFSTESFPEFQYMAYIVIALAVIFVIVALLRNKTLLIGAIILFMVLGVIGIWDMYSWLNLFGSNLDPTAPITMDAIDIPIMGENIIANFTTYSYFALGAYLLGIAFILLIFPLWKDRKNNEKTS